MLFSVELPHVHAWSPDTPYLYTAVFTLLDERGTPIDFEAAHVGFKRVELRENVMTLNGKRLIVRGINRHEHSLKNGRAVTLEEMEMCIRDSQIGARVLSSIEESSSLNPWACQRGYRKEKIQSFTVMLRHSFRTDSPSAGPENRQAETRLSVRWYKARS